MMILILALMGISFVSFATLTSIVHGSSCPLNNASYEIEGCVVDPNNNPVSGLNVYVIVSCSGSYITVKSTSDVNGYFSLQQTFPNGRSCLANIAYPVSVNGVTFVTASPSCPFPSCNVLGQNVDNPGWGQWVGDVTPGYDGYTVHASVIIQVQPGQIVNLPVAGLYSDTGFASLAYTTSTSTGYSVSFSGGAGGVTAGFSSSYTNTFSSKFGDFPPNSQVIVAYPYYAIPYFCNGSSSFGFSCSYGLQKVGISGRVPNGAYVYLPTSEYIPNPNPPPMPSLKCNITGPQELDSTHDVSSSLSFGLTSQAQFYGVTATFSYTVSTSSSTSATTGVIISSTNFQALNFLFYPATGGCPGGSSGMSFGPELHVWDLSPPPDYSISANPALLGTYPGSSVSSAISLASANGLSGTVSLSALAPPGIAVFLNPTTVTLSPSGSSTATLNLLSNIAAGTYTVTITGTCNTGQCSPTITHSVNIQVQVRDFMLWANPSSATVFPTNVATSTVTVASLNGFTGTVGLGWQVSPSTGLSCTLNPGSITLGSSATSTLLCSGSVGSYTVIVNGTSGPTSHSTTFGVTVTDYILSVNPSVLYWTCTPWCSPGLQSANLTISTNAAYATDTTFTLFYGCGVGSPSCSPTYGIQPGTITIPAGQLSGTATLTVQPGLGQSCTKVGGKTNCYTYIVIIAKLNRVSVSSTSLTLYACHGLCPV